MKFHPLYYHLAKLLVSTSIQYTVLKIETTFSQKHNLHTQMRTYNTIEKLKPNVLNLREIKSRQA